MRRLRISDIVDATLEGVVNGDGENISMAGIDTIAANPEHQASLGRANKFQKRYSR